MIQEEDPASVGEPAVHLHAMVMDLGPSAVVVDAPDQPLRAGHREIPGDRRVVGHHIHVRPEADIGGHGAARSEEHPSELQSLMRISYAVFGLKKKRHITTI